jgi:putative OPT family oligopeptide transporter
VARPAPHAAAHAALRVRAVPCDNRRHTQVIAETTEEERFMAVVDEVKPAEVRAGAEPEFKPYVPPESGAAEITLRAVLIGVAIGIIYGAANAYLGLQAGQTVSASIPAAVIGMAILAGVFRSKNVLENNIVQTIGSSGESLAAGVVFTVPALILLGADPSIAQIFMLAGIGGLLGMLFMIPLRRYLIVQEHGKLAFPEGTACAEILITGEQGGSKFRYVLTGIGVGAVYRFVAEVFRPWATEAGYTFMAMNKARFSTEGLPALLGVGFIIGPRVASFMFAGGVLGWFVVIPLIVFFGSGWTVPVPPEPTQLIRDMAPEGGAGIWGRYLRYIGAGAVATGGLISVARAMPSLISSFGVLFGEMGSIGKGLKGSRLRTERDLPTWFLIAGVAAAVVFLWVTLGRADVFSLVAIVLTMILAFFFVAVAARICGLVGSSASPVSGMTITALLVTSLVFVSIGLTGREGMIAALTVGAVICIAICMSGDMSQDLKTGYLLGATPWKQQAMNVVGNFAAAATIGAVVYYLHHNVAGGIGGDDLPAPQATLMRFLTEGIFGGNLPWGLLFIGMAIGVVVEVLGLPSLPIAIGLYLPLSTTSAIFFGGLAARAVQKLRSGPAEAEANERGVLIGSGLVAGDAIIGLATIGIGQAVAFGYMRDLGVFENLTGRTGAEVVGELAWEVWSFGVFMALTAWLIWMVLRKPAPAPPDAEAVVVGAPGYGDLTANRPPQERLEE